MIKQAPSDALIMYSFMLCLSILMLYRNTHDIELVRKFLGHSDVQTTWGYIVDIYAEEEDRCKVVEALKCLSNASTGCEPKSNNIISFRPSERNKLHTAGISS